MGVMLVPLLGVLPCVVFESVFWSGIDGFRSQLYCSLAVYPGASYVMLFLNGGDPGAGAHSYLRVR